MYTVYQKFSCKQAYEPFTSEDLQDADLLCDTQTDRYVPVAWRWNLCAMKCTLPCGAADLFCNPIGKHQMICVVPADGLYRL